MRINALNRSLWGGRPTAGELDDCPGVERPFHLGQISNQFAHLHCLAQPTGRDYLLDVGSTLGVVDELGPGEVGFAVKVVGGDGVDRYAVGGQVHAERFHQRILWHRLGRCPGWPLREGATLSDRR